MVCGPDSIPAWYGERLPRLMPSPNPARPPPFHELEDGHFEELCCALLDKESEIRTAELYRAPRQPQFGIDVLGRRHDKGIEVVSCKCYGQVRRGQIPEWCNDFLQHWDAHWSLHRVRRFILAIAADTRSRQRQDEVDEQRAQVHKTWSRVGDLGPSPAAGEAPSSLRYRCPVPRRCRCRSDLRPATAFGNPTHS